MKQMTKIQQALPAGAKKFFVRALIIFIGWSLLYHLLLKPLNFPDHQLSSVIQWGTAKMLAPFYPDVSREGPSVLINGIRAINIAPQCNGLDLIVLYLGFLFCLPTSKKNMLIYGISGTVIISFLNVIRCALLAWMYFNHHPLADFAHHMAFKMIIYGAVFYGWILYSKHYQKQQQHAVQA